MSKILLNVSDLTDLINNINQSDNNSSNNEDESMRIRMFVQLVDIRYCEPDRKGRRSQLVVQDLTDYRKRDSTDGCDELKTVSLMIDDSLFQEVFGDGFKNSDMGMAPQLGDPIDIRIGLWNNGVCCTEVLDIKRISLQELTILKEFLSSDLGKEFLGI
ncbi:hypothetical protein Kpol_1004p8 [Vanderwaltozyma polyspora DSM 70294]|uniref:Uncharacterized protein n=1 Tax=Vanderwaltozyma polyspora (strain ATCC 22028 / DSM 70294 / BCRC 21397 / CBS 2163 / NBRC 10782 / NRRL Y-8283 / UCD 57-17) TaxID=436907 RepID=A7TJ67_VANPO|nr:uncharacterized protein Kpol_1004p8 [Vanderwaltozyma polyspora DSM 70294]EDO17636.1 hypothetical protein Kpol_1004p8 [Vanderwaltozyma polyspora DSM 70294]